MLHAIHHTSSGTEIVEGANTLVFFPVASGLVIIDTLVNGLSLDLAIDNTRGLVYVPGTLQRGDLVQILYKTLPRLPIPEPPDPGAGMTDFEPADFEAADFT